MSDPLFSVLIAAYEAEATLSETLDSLLAQTEPQWEAIVVDDGSTDRTHDIAASYAATDARIQALRQDNAGAGAARNAAAARARGRWLIALDADDLLVPDALERQALFIEQNPGYEIYSWGAWKLLADGSRVPFDDSEEYRATVTFTLEDLVERNRILSNTCIDAGVFASIGGFRSLYTEDYDLWLRAMLAGARHLHNPEMLAVYRMRESSKSTDAWRNMSGTAEVLERFAEAGDVERGLADRARERAAYWRAWAARTEMETRLAAREYSRARELAHAARPTFPEGLRTRAGLALLAVSPSAYAWYKRRRAVGA